MPEKVKVSFIIPVYNVGQFLPQCLDSICNQSVRDIEIVCINDCSPDNSQAILESYAARDGRFKLIEFVENRGPGAARNAGLDTVTGEFVRMVDGDDMIPPDSTEMMMDAAAQYKSDFVRGGFRTCDGSGNLGKNGWGFPAKLVVNTSVRKDQRLWRFDQHWAYLFRRTTLVASGARYDENMRNGQDAAFMADLMASLDNVTFIPETVYYYRENPASIMRRKRSKEFYLNVLGLYERVYRNMGSIDLLEAADNIFFLALSNYLPNNILPSLPDNLDQAEAIDILRYLHKILVAHDGKKLCFERTYEWQKKQQVSLESKYLTLMLCEGYVDDVYHDLKRIAQRRNREKRLSEKILAIENKLNNIYASTSWKMTAPVRKLGAILKKEQAAK